MNLADVFSNYFTVRQELLEGVKNLTQEQLDWTAPQHTATIGKLLAHIAETEYWWVDCVANGREEMEFSPFENARSSKDILSLLDEQHRVFTEYLERESTDDWDSVFYAVKGRKEKVSKRWLVWHTVEHQARHRGQIFMMLRMQGLFVPDV